MKAKITVFKKMVPYEGKAFPTYYTRRNDGSFGNVRFVKAAKNEVEKIADFPRLVVFDPEDAFIGTRKKGEAVYTDLCIAAFEDGGKYSDTAAVIGWLGSDGEAVDITTPASTESDALPF